MWTENPIFREDLDRLTSYDYIPWDDLRDSTVFITGATGLIGYTAVCALLRYDQLHDAAPARLPASISLTTRWRR